MKRPALLLAAEAPSTSRRGYKVGVWSKVAMYVILDHCPPPRLARASLHRTQHAIDPQAAAQRIKWRGRDAPPRVRVDADAERLAASHGTVRRLWKPQFAPARDGSGRRRAKPARSAGTLVEGVGVARAAKGD